MPKDAAVALLDLPVGRWSVDATLLSCNAAYERAAGEPLSALRGRTLADLHGEDFWSQAREAFISASAGRSAHIDHRAARPNLGPRWCRLMLLPERDARARVAAVQTLALDIHDDMQRLELLEDARRRLHHFADNIPHPLIYVDANLTLRFANRAYTEAISRDPDALSGPQNANAGSAAAWQEHRPYFEQALAGQAAHHTRLARRPEGESRWLRTSYTPDLTAGGAVAGIYTLTVDVHDLTLAQQRLQQRVERDELTDALSRRTMMDRIESAVTQAGSQPVALYFVDLDGFKEVNDAFGHDQGDALLVSAAQALRSKVRQDDAVGRFGGDEFLVLAQVRDAAGAHALGRHLLTAVAAGCRLPEGGPQVTASIGFALAPVDALQPLRLLQLADEAMYAAKRAGRNAVLRTPTAQGLS